MNVKKLSLKTLCTIKNTCITESVIRLFKNHPKNQSVTLNYVIMTRIEKSTSICNTLNWANMYVTYTLPLLYNKGKCCGNSGSGNKYKCKLWQRFCHPLFAAGDIRFRYVYSIFLNLWNKKMSDKKQCKNDSLKLWILNLGKWNAKTMVNNHIHFDDLLIIKLKIIYFGWSLIGCVFDFKCFSL